MKFPSLPKKLHLILAVPLMALGGIGMLFCLLLPLFYRRVLGALPEMAGPAREAGMDSVIGTLRWVGAGLCLFLIAAGILALRRQTWRLRLYQKACIGGYVVASLCACTVMKLINIAADAGVRVDDDAIRPLAALAIKAKFIIPALLAAAIIGILHAIALRPATAEYYKGEAKAMPARRFIGRRDLVMRRSVVSSIIAHFLLIVLLPLLLSGGVRVEPFLLPAGGGGPDLEGARGGPKPVILKLQAAKKIRPRKFLLSRNSPIKFGVPDVDEMVQGKVTQYIADATVERYGAGRTGYGAAASGQLGMGEGEGDGPGYGFGSKRGAIHFVRIKYDGGDWDQKLGKGADYNLLLEHKLRTGQKVHHETEFRTITEIDRFDKYANQPLLYITGQRDIRLSDDEIRILRRYLLEKHGMIFADNGGSAAFGARFRSLMRRILPEVQPIQVPSDDTLYRRPMLIPSLPYVSPHDPPMVATGWKYQGRWVGYYHPGDLGDAWKDGHAGVSREVADAAFNLGINLIAYANQQYGQWWLEMHPRGAKQK